MISSLFSCSEKAIENDLYGPRSDIRNGRHSGRQFRKIQAESKVKSRGRANSESIPSPPLPKLEISTVSSFFLCKKPTYADHFWTYVQVRTEARTLNKTN